MLRELLFVFFLLNLRATILFASIRIIKGTLGISGCLTLSFVLSFYCFPHSVTEQVLERPAFSITIEVLLGLFLGIVMSFLIEYIPLMGRLVDTFRGVQFQEQVAPELGNRDSKLEIYSGYIVLLFIFQTKVFSRIIEVFISCTNNLGVGGLRGDAFIDVSRYFCDKRGALIEVLSKIFYSSLVVVSPLVVFSLCLEVGLSMLVKINSKSSLGPELSLIRAFAGILVIPLIITHSEIWQFLLSNLVQSVWNFFRHTLLR